MITMLTSYNELKPKWGCCWFLFVQMWTEHLEKSDKDGRVSRHRVVRAVRPGEDARGARLSLNS